MDQTPMERLNVGREYLKLGQEDGLLVREDDLTYPTLDVIWVGLEYGRVMFPPSGSNPDCRSTDGVMPSGGEQPESGPCASCPMAQWRHGERPQCDEVFTMLLLTQPGDEPLAFQVKGLGIRNLGKLKSRLQVYCGRPVIRIEGKRIEQVGKRAFYLPKFTILPGAEWATGAGNALDLIAQPKSAQLPSPGAPPAAITMGLPPAAPDLSQPGWEDMPIPLEAAAGRTWRELSATPRGQAWLGRLAASQTRPDLAECAAAALGLAAGLSGEVPF
mgnify:CR=1 FL=1